MRRTPDSLCKAQAGHLMAASLPAVPPASALATVAEMLPFTILATTLTRTPRALRSLQKSALSQAGYKHSEPALQFLPPTLLEDAEVAGGG